MTTHAEVAATADVQKAIPALAALAERIGDRQVRNMGTIGGSLANNDPAADYPAAVLALERDRPSPTSARSPPTTSSRACTRRRSQPDEIITAVSFPVPQKAAYAKFTNPASRFALVGVFVAQTRRRRVRVAVTGAASGVFRVERARGGARGELSRRGDAKA